MGLEIRPRPQSSGLQDAVCIFMRLSHISISLQLNSSLLLTNIGSMHNGNYESFAWIGEISLDYRSCFLTNGVFDSKAKTSKRIPPSGPQTICRNYEAPCLLAPSDGRIAEIAERLVGGN